VENGFFSINSKLLFKQYKYLRAPTKMFLISNNIQGVPELAPQRKQACADNKKDSKLTKINFLLAQITELQSF
jgi:hypothetical protein